MLTILPRFGVAACIANATTDDIATAKESAISNATSEPVSENGYLKFNVQSDDGSSIWYFFAETSHPAHPAFVTIKVYEEDSSMRIRLSGFTAGDCNVFSAWFKQFEAMRQAMQEQYGQ